MNEEHIVQRLQGLHKHDAKPCPCPGCVTKRTLVKEISAAGFTGGDTGLAAVHLTVQLLKDQLLHAPAEMRERIVSFATRKLEATAEQLAKKKN